MNRKLWLVAALIGAGLMSARSVNAETIYGLNESGTNIFSFDSTNTGKIQSGKFLTGLATNEQLLTIDIRPSSGAIYGVGSLGNLYTINAGTGATTKVASITGATIDGTNFDGAFNPVSSGFSATGDTLQFTSDTGINWNINPSTGVATPQSTLAYGTGDTHTGGNVNVVGIAYSGTTASGSSSGVTSATLYGIDSGFDSLVTLATPPSGKVTTVGALGINVTDLVGFDIDNSGTALAALQTTTSGISNLYRVNLTTGAATLIGEIGGGLLVRDIAIVPGGGASPVPEPASLGLLGLGTAALWIRRRRRRA